MPRRLTRLNKYVYTVTTTHAVEAIKWDGGFPTHKEITEWLGEGYDVAMGQHCLLHIKDNETGVEMTCNVGNYVVRREDGSVVPLTAHKIEQKYKKIL